MKFWHVVLCALILVGCSSGVSVVGTYHVEQENNAIGEDAEKGELELREDKSFQITFLSLRLASGTYTTTDSTVKLSETTGKLAMEYKVLDGKLIPVVGGKQISNWRFVKK